MDSGLRDEMLPPQRPGTVSALLLSLRQFLLSVVDWLQGLLVPRIVKVGPYRLTLRRLIAEGGFSYVHAALDVSSGRQFAVKEVVCQTSEQKTQLKREVEAHELFSHDKRHDNLMPLLGHAFLKSRNGDRGYLVFPLMGRTLQDVLNSNAFRARSAASSDAPYFSETACLHIAQGLARALHALHQAGRTHRDVCPRNVLLAEARDGRGPAGARVDTPTMPHPVLSDFGSLAPTTVFVGTRADAARVMDEASVNSSPPYRAPELWHCEPGTTVGAPVDVFSLGATIYACAFGLSPFESVRNEADGRLRIVEPSHTRTLNGIQFPSAHAFSRSFIELLLAMCAQASEQRPTLEQVIQQTERMLGMRPATGVRGAEDSV